MQIQIGDKIEIQSDFRTQTLIATVVDIADITSSIHYRVISSCYDHWVHESKVIKRLSHPVASLFDDSNTVVQHVDDLYR